MRRLEQLCVQYLDSTVNYTNVLEAFHNADSLNLYFIKELCLRLIVRESNFNQIVMSKDFELLDKNLMVEIIRRRQAPHIKRLQESTADAAGKHLGA